MALWWLYGGYVFPVVVQPESLTFEVKFDLEGQGQLPPKTMGTLTKVFYTYGPNLVIHLSMNGWGVIARTSIWLPHTQTHKQTDAGNDNTRRPKLASGKYSGGPGEEWRWGHTVCRKYRARRWGAGHTHAHFGSTLKTVFLGMGITIIKIKRSWDCRIFIIGISHTHLWALKSWSS